MFLTVADRNAPTKTKRVRHSGSAWLTRKIKSLTVKRDRVKVNAKKCNDPKLWSEYKSLRNLVNREIASSKKRYYNAKFSKYSRNAREIWKSINSIQGKARKAPLITEINLNDTIADLLNSHFTNIGPQLAAQLLNPLINFRQLISPAPSNFHLLDLSPMKPVDIIWSQTNRLV